MPKPSLDDLNERIKGRFPHLLGITGTHRGERSLDMEMPIRPEHLAPNNFLHAGAIVTLADTAAGFGCLSHLPDGAEGFTTIELKSNFVGTARSGLLKAHARAVHLGRMTHLWDVTVTHAETAKTLALFRCTQMILWPK